MGKKEPVITKSFGKFSVCALKEGIGLRVYVTDGNKNLNIPLLPDKSEVIESLKRLEGIKNEIDNLDYFSLVVAGSLLISMKSNSLYRIE